MDSQKETSFTEESPSAYEADDGPLSTEDLARIREAANPMLPSGKVLSTRSIFKT